MANTCESRNQNATPEEKKQTGSTITAQKREKQHKHKAANIYLLCLE